MCCVRPRSLPRQVRRGRLNKLRHIVVLLVAVAGTESLLHGHENITTKLTWAREVSRIVFARCAGCHRPEGRAFSLLTYEEARPWAKAMQEEVLRRRMPPWKAVKGFNSFAHEMGLSAEEMHTIADWVDGGAPEGDKNLVPAAPRASYEPLKLRGLRVPVRGQMQVGAALRVVGVELGEMAAGQSFKLVAEQPDGTRVPLIWVNEFAPQAVRAYEFSEAIVIPRGSRVVAYPGDGVVVRLVTATGTSRRR